MANKTPPKRNNTTPTKIKSFFSGLHNSNPRHSPDGKTSPTRTGQFLHFFAGKLRRRSYDDTEPFFADVETEEEKEITIGCRNEHGNKTAAEVGRDPPKTEQQGNPRN